MKKFIKVLDAVIDTDWLISCWLNKDHTCLKVRQLENIMLEFTGKPNELKPAFDFIWDQVNQVQGQSKKVVRYGRA